jgi:drug/metabolite transporter (DMT)-like permease
MEFSGVIIAVFTVVCWTVSVQFFEAASKRVGPTPVNIIRMAIAFVLFSTLLLIRDGVPIPMNFPLRAWVFLSLSGIVGFFIGDIFLFKALVELGPRVAMLIHSLAAPTAAVIGWIFLDEHYGFSQWLGIGITLCGVGMVIMERNKDHTTRRRGIQRNITLAVFSMDYWQWPVRPVGWF